MQPVTLHSLLPPLDPKAAAAAQASTADDHAEPITAASSSRARRFNLQAFRRSHAPHMPIADPLEHRSKPAKKKEIDRELQDGEDVRLAVVIQMPTAGDGVKKRQSWGSDDEEEEEVGWEMGMELGVWEGSVGR